MLILTLLTTNKSSNMLKMCSIETERIYYDDDSHSSIPFYKQFETDSLLVDISGAVSVKWNSKTDYDFTELDYVSIDVCDQDGDVLIDDNLFGEITKNLEFTII
tara:strand:- start:5428 stop:5739 length:312 start_codon:yes stop_codon:yes gene_type:complete